MQSSAYEVTNISVVAKRWPWYFYSGSKCFPTELKRRASPSSSAYTILDANKYDDSGEATWSPQFDEHFKAAPHLFMSLLRFLIPTSTCRVWLPGRGLLQKNWVKIHATTNTVFSIEITSLILRKWDVLNKPNLCTKEPKKHVTIIITCTSSQYKKLSWK